jgi:WD40 repeat protein
VSDVFVSYSRKDIAFARILHDALKAHEDSVNDLSFSSDGRYLATAGGNVAYVWLWRPEDLVTEACSRLTRNLTQEEWQQYLPDEPYHATCPNLP